MCVYVVCMAGNPTKVKKMLTPFERRVYIEEETESYFQGRYGYFNPRKRFEFS